LPVFATDRGGAAESLRNRLVSAKSGDIIEVFDDVAASDINTGISNAKNLTIQGHAGRSVTWRCPESGTKLLTLNAAAGMTLRNITFDGGGKLDSLVTLFGESPGLTVDNVQFRGFRRFGVQIINCAGSPQQPVTIADSRFTTTSADQTAVYFDLLPNVRGIDKNRNVTIRGCVFKGPGARVQSRDLSMVEAVECPDGVIAAANRSK
jgi:hypothetical protein